jgi:hypothetical protein
MRFIFFFFFLNYQIFKNFNLSRLEWGTLSLFLKRSKIVKNKNSFKKITTTIFLLEEKKKKVPDMLALTDDG